MKNSKKLYISAFLTASAVLLASCGSDNGTAPETETDVSVTSSAETLTDQSSDISLSDVSSSEEKSTSASITTGLSGKETTVTVSTSTASSANSEKAAETTKHPVNTASPDDVPAPPKTEANIIPSNLENKPGMPPSDESPSSESSEVPAPPANIPDEPEETDSPVPDNGDVTVILTGNTAECSSDRVTVNGSTVTVSAEGIYRFSGDLEGQIIVNAPKDVQVIIELNGVNIRNNNDSAIIVESCDKVKISSGAGTTNYLSDGGASSACIYSKDDLTLKGEGTIVINGNSKNAVYSKNTLKVTGGTLEINSANNALTGKDKVIVETGNITINSAKDGIKATNDTDTGKGTVTIKGGSLTITAGDDAIQAISGVTVTGCSVQVKAEGKKVNCDINVAVDEGCISKIQ